MKILSHPDIEQIDEHRNASGELFSPVVRLRGHQTYMHIYKLFQRGLMADIQRDMQEEAYEAVFIEPDSFEITDDCEEQMLSEALIASLVTGYGIQDACDRADEKYSGLCLHNHTITPCTATTCLEEGELETLFVQDPLEVLQAMLDQQAEIESIVGDELDKDLHVETGRTVLERVIHASDTLYRKFNSSSSNSERCTRLRNLQERIQDALTFKVTRKPVRGHVSVFAGKVLHSASMKRIKGRAGDLYVKHWEGKLAP